MQRCLDGVCDTGGQRTVDTSREGRKRERMRERKNETDLLTTLALLASTPLCKTVDGSAKLAIAPPKFDYNHRPWQAEGKIVINNYKIVQI